MFSKHNFCVEHDSYTPESRTIFSQSDLTVGQFNVETQIMSVGIFRTTSSLVPTCFRKQISASSKIAIKSTRGSTRPPRLRVEIKVFSPSVLDFKERIKACIFSLDVSFLFLDVLYIFETIYPAIYDKGPRSV